MLNVTKLKGNLVLYIFKAYVCYIYLKMYAMVIKILLNTQNYIVICAKVIMTFNRKKLFQ